MSETVQLQDGARLNMPPGREITFICCSCSLAHDMLFGWANGKIVLTVKANPKATEEARGVDIDAVHRGRE